jgi:hypothetical protein
MRTTAEKKANRKLGYVRLVIVSSTTAVLIALGLGVAYVNAPSAGHPCGAPNATSRDSAGRTMWCNPTMSGNQDMVWQYASGS